MSTIDMAEPHMHGLTWGKAVKGAVLVGAVGLAFVGAMYGIGLVTAGAGTAIATGGTLDALAATTVSGIVHTGGFLAAAAQGIADLAASAWQGLPSFLGISGNSLAAPVTALHAEAVGTTLKVVGGGAAVAIAAHAVAPKLAATLSAPVAMPDISIDLPSHTDTATTLVPAIKTTVVHNDMSHVAHTAHHAHHAHELANAAAPDPSDIEEAMEGGPRHSARQQSRGWRETLESRKASAAKQTQASNVDASTQPAAAKAHTPRDPNFSRQLDADRANLRAVLSENGRV